MNPAPATNTKKPTTTEVVKKAVTADDLDIPKKGRIMDLLENKLDSNHLNKDDLNLEFNPFHMQYPTYEMFLGVHWYPIYEIFNTQFSRKF